MPDDVSVLEIGVGTGTFKDLVKGTRYLGADLQPLDTATIALDLDRDPLPAGHFDYAVLLGVFAYLHQPHAAAKKLCEAADHVIVSYCCRRSELALGVVLESRQRRGWVNHFDRLDFVQIFAQHGHELAESSLLLGTEELDELLMTFRRASPSSELGRR